MKNISVSLDDDTYKKLRNLKSNHHINISSFIVSAIKDKLGKDENIDTHSN